MLENECVNKMSVLRRVAVKSWIFILLIPLLTSCATIKSTFCAYDTLNFYTIQEGILYRSAQPSGKQLFGLVQKYNIRSVINLRGAQRGESWYDSEKAVSDRLGVQRVDIEMSADRLPHREDLIQLLDAYRDLPRPILIHCKAGADRTGEAAAIFGMDHLKWSRRKAAAQLDPLFGHLEKFTPAKDYFILKVYQGEDWARNTYDPCQQDYGKHYDKSRYCAVAPAARPYSIEDDDER